MATSKIIRVDVVNVEKDHDAELQRVISEHLLSGWTLATVVYCPSTGAWPAHFMVFFTREDDKK